MPLAPQPINPAKSGIFLDLQGVTGDSQDPDFPNQIVVLSLQFPDQLIQAKELSIAKNNDVASPVLLLKSLNQDVIPSGTLTHVTVSASTGKVPTLRLKMTNIVIAGVTISGGSVGDTPIENVTLEFEKLEVFAGATPPSSTGATGTSSAGATRTPLRLMRRRR
jgi:type VI protein secretion system component Hcp